MKHIRKLTKISLNQLRKQVEKEYSGKGDVSKKKKEKPFDFQAELMKNLPDHPKPASEKTDPEKGEGKLDSKMGEIDNLMNDKMGKLDTLMTMLEKKNIDSGVASTVGNVREILAGSIKEQVSEAATEVVSEAIDKADGK
jgi:hypothetical protein